MHTEICKFCSSVNYIYDVPTDGFLCWNCNHGNLSFDLELEVGVYHLSPILSIGQSCPELEE